MKTLAQQIKEAKQALKTCDPKSRDRLRHRLHRLLVAQQIKRELRAA